MIAGRIPKIKKNDEFLDFYEITLYMIFKISHFFQENRKKHIKGEFVKIPEFALVIIFMIFAQK